MRFFGRFENKKFRRKPPRLILNVRISRTRRIRKFFSSSVIKKVLVLVAFVGIGVFGVMACRRGVEAFFEDPQYRLQEISVFTQRTFTKEDILNLSGISLGMAPFDFSVKKVSQEIEKNPNVKKADVERIFPNKVMIKVVERTPIAVVTGKREWLIDEDGVVLPLREMKPIGLVTLTGVGVTEEQMGHTLTAEGVRKGLALLREYQRTDLPFSMEFRQVDVTHPKNPTVTTKSGVKVYFGEGDYERKIQKFIWVLGDLAERGKMAESVDLRFKDVVVQPLKVKPFHPATAKSAPKQTLITFPLEVR